MNRKTTIIAVLVLVIVAGILIFAKDPIIDKFSPAKTVETPKGGPNGNDVYSPTHVAAPTTIVIPDANTTGLPENVAIPDKVVESPTSNSSLRVFDITANGGKFSPDTVAVKQNDSVRITINAVDKDYDFVQPEMGFNFTIAKGTSKNLDFSSVNVGKFTFYCERCGGLKGSAVGYIIVAPK
jgi:hypothetical protein